MWKLRSSWIWLPTEHVIQVPAKAKMSRKSHRVRTRMNLHHIQHRNLRLLSRLFSEKHYICFIREKREMFIFDSFISVLPFLDFSWVIENKNDCVVTMEIEGIQSKPETAQGL